MSFRIFNSQKNDTISDYINKQCTKENMNIQKILYKLSDGIFLNNLSKIL